VTGPLRSVGSEKAPGVGTAVRGGEADGDAEGRGDGAACADADAVADAGTRADADADGDADARADADGDAEGDGDGDGDADARADADGDADAGTGRALLATTTPPAMPASAMATPTKMAGFPVDGAPSRRGSWTLSNGVSAGSLFARFGAPSSAIGGAVGGALPALTIGPGRNGVAAPVAFASALAFASAATTVSAIATRLAPSVIRSGNTSAIARHIARAST